MQSMIKNKRSPYAALQTSLGCQFKCDFCMINIINRNDNDEVGVSSNYNKRDIGVQIL